MDNLFGKWIQSTISSKTHPLADYRGSANAPGIPANARLSTMVISPQAGRELLGPSTYCSQVPILICPLLLMRGLPAQQQNSRLTYGMTRKSTLLLSVLLGVSTVTNPVVAPAGTIARIKVSDTTVKLALVPFKKTPVVCFSP